MLTRPAYILALDLDTRDPGFPAQCAAWTRQMRCEMNDLVVLSRATIAASRTLLDETDRLLARVV